MAEKLKYKVGDKVLIEMEIADIRCELAYPYILEVPDGTPLTHVNENFFNKPSVRPLIKPKITQDLMDWYEVSGKELDFDLFDLFSDFNKGHSVPPVVYNWLTDGEGIKGNQERQYALATLIAYGPEAVEVEKEKRYRVKTKSFGSTYMIRQNLIRSKGGYYFNTLATRDDVYDFTKQELIAAGFEGVFDNPMFEVEEVE